MGIALAEAQRMNLALPGLALAHQLYVCLLCGSPLCHLSPLHYVFDLTLLITMSVLI